MTTNPPEGISHDHLLALAKKCGFCRPYLTKDMVDAITGYARVVLNDKAVQEAFVRANRSAILEEAAQVCDKWVDVNHVYENGALVCAKAIRKLARGELK